MLKNMPHLCKYMPEPKDARRLIPDVPNEPNFEEINQRYPLPDRAGQIGRESAAANALRAAPAAVSLKKAAQQPSFAQARLASEVPWLVNPPAKRLATEAPVVTELIQPPRVPAAATSRLSAIPPNLQQQLAAAGLGSLAPPLRDPSSLEVMLRERALIAALRERQQQQQLQQAQQLQQSLASSLVAQPTDTSVAASALAAYLQSLQR